MKYIDDLIEYCNQAKAAKPVQTFELTNLSQLESLTHGIYIIEQVDGDIEQTFADLSAFKKTKARACPKLNRPSSVMYVGSSTTGLKKRIVQHLGDGPKQTYALHLSHWFRGKYRITIRVYSESPEVIQIIEDAISFDLAPAFGKQGGNNK
ncbi:hypothetical protein [Reinekea blandensis]|uniref:GIY-YIG domain-containing protein n=1 Tax=Reinekea blandensis MED297 TaxID=314283 RepID=A4BDH6_9GAMM|nr:hypothetical protein [Reinekea blandensis]EAR09920.1 hypothetical protein MED297_06209 [Reinekea sp. MED297] [Reinekea blandensis MED297]